MTHFFIRSGSFSAEIDAPTPKEAVFTAFKDHLDPLVHKGLFIFTKASTFNDNTDHDEDIYYDTPWLLENAGLSEYYEIDDDELTAVAKEIDNGVAS